MTAVLKNLLDNGVIDPAVNAVAGDVSVSALPPDRIRIGSNERNQLNLFLYQVTPNSGWRNAGLPSRDGQGDRLTNPPLALDLHYLLTAYGAQDFHAEILLGYAMQVLHETPVLSREGIRSALASPSPVSGGILPQALRALSAAELAEQVEQIKIHPQPLTTEEASKLWSAFQANYYRPSAAYRVSVVLIESRDSTKSSLPVRALDGRYVYVQPFRQPVIEQVLSRTGVDGSIAADQPITIDSKLVIRGRKLLADSLEVQVQGVTASLQAVSDTQIVLALPPSLHAGVQGVQVVYRTSMGTPPEPHHGVESNVAAFVLCPRVIRATPATQPATGTTPRSGDVTIEVAPEIGKEQRVVLLLNEFDPPRDRATPGRAYSFDAPARSQQDAPQTAPTITIPISGVMPGRYLVRLQVDGAESPLTAGVSGKYDSPQVTIQ